MKKDTKVILICIAVVLVIFFIALMSSEEAREDLTQPRDEWLNDYVEDLADSKATHDKEKQNTEDYFDMVGIR